MSGRIFNRGDFEIAEGGGVKDGADVFGSEGLKFFGKIVVRGEWNCFLGAQRSWVGGLFAF